MHILVKGYYGYKNLGDELIIFSLLNWLEDRFSPEQIDIECGDAQRLESRILQHKYFLIPGIVAKLKFLQKPSRKEKIQLCLGLKKGKYDFIIFGGGEVIDESRSFLYRGRNLLLQYRRDIKHGHTALIGGLGTNKKLGTNFLQKFLTKNANFIILRDKQSEILAQNILKSGQNLHTDCEERIQYTGDLSLPILEEAKIIFAEENIKSQGPYYLINHSPLCNQTQALTKIKEFSDTHKGIQPIYIACNDYEDKQFFNKVLEIIPNCEFFDWTQSSIAEIIKLFYFAEAGIGARLHFLYILKLFQRPFVQLHSSHKIESNLSDLD